MDEASAVRNDAELKSFRDRWIGRKSGILTQINDLWLKSAPKDAKREAGIRVNELKARIHERVEAAHVAGDDNVTTTTAAERVDITLPGLRRPVRDRVLLADVSRRLGRSARPSGPPGPAVRPSSDALDQLLLPPAGGRAI